MEEHIGNCADLFGLRTENKDIEKRYLNKSVLS
jgi:hypothetical protein